MRLVAVLFLLPSLLLVSGCAPERRRAGSGDLADAGERDSDGGGPGSADAGFVPGPCRFDSDCGAGRCDRSRNECVRCMGAADCGAGSACRQGGCLPAVECTSSRACPGQVCDVARGTCADCATDADCLDGGRCRDGYCLAPPRPCTSSRQCSEFGQVCDAAAASCADCLGDADCEPGQYCERRTCHARVCTPNARECLTASRVRVCESRGTGWGEGTCGAGTSCRGGECVAQQCVPSSATCASITSRRACSADGLSSETIACGAQESCFDGQCHARMCQPGSVSCQDARRFVCSADGLGMETSACPAPPNTVPKCAGTACSFDCVEGWADCDGRAGNGCEAKLDRAETCGRCDLHCSDGTVCEAGRCAACGAGTRLCRGVCAGDVATETCDGVDDDCDGRIDEGCAQGTCASPHVLAPAGATLTGQMTGQGTQQASCGAPGVDRIYKWTAPRDGTARVTMSGDFWPAALWVRRGSCGSGAEAGCDYKASQWPHFELAFPVAANEVLYIGVDARWAGTGYTLTYNLAVAMQ